MRDKKQQILHDKFRRFLVGQSVLDKLVLSKNDAFHHLSKEDQQLLIKKIAEFDTFYSSEHNFGCVVFKSKLWTWEIPNIRRLVLFVFCLC